MRANRHPLQMVGIEPAVTQLPLNGWNISWNPDDSKFYIGPDQSPKAAFADWRNATYWARTHPVGIKQSVS